MQNLDINGLACSIELYFGAEILTDRDSYIPIQWTGYDKQLKKYQGVIQNKNLVQKRFDEKLKSEVVTVENWKEMTLLIEGLISAWK